MSESAVGGITVQDASKGALFVLFLVTMIDMIGFGIVIPFLTYLVEDLTPEGQTANIGLWVGLLMTSYSAAQFLFSPFWGSVSDRIGRRPVLMVGLVGNTVFFTLFGLANTLILAFVARFLAGVFNGNIAVARAYIGDVSTPQQLATRMGIIGAAFGLGFTFGPFIGGELSDPASRWAWFESTIFDTHPYLLPCLVASVLSVFSLIIAFRYSLRVRVRVLRGRLARVEVPQPRVSRRARLRAPSAGAGAGGGRRRRRRRRHLRRRRRARRRLRAVDGAHRAEGGRCHRQGRELRHRPDRSVLRLRRARRPVPVRRRRGLDAGVVEAAQDGRLQVPAHEDARPDSDPHEPVRGDREVQGGGDRHRGLVRAVRGVRRGVRHQR